jgi:hypothetical protein
MRDENKNSHPDLFFVLSKLCFEFVFTLSQRLRIQKINVNERYRTIWEHLTLSIPIKKRALFS